MNDLEKLHRSALRRLELLAKAYTLLLQVGQIGIQGQEIDKLITEIKLELGI